MTLIGETNWCNKMPNNTPYTDTRNALAIV